MPTEPESLLESSVEPPLTPSIVEPPLLDETTEPFPQDSAWAESTASPESPASADLDALITEALFTEEPESDGAPHGAWPLDTSSEAQPEPTGDTAALADLTPLTPLTPDDPSEAAVEVAVAPVESLGIDSPELESPELESPERESPELESPAPQPAPSEASAVGEDAASAFDSLDAMPVDLAASDTIEEEAVEEEAVIVAPLPVDEQGSTEAWTTAEASEFVDMTGAASAPESIEDLPADEAVVAGGGVDLDALLSDIDAPASATDATSEVADEITSDDVADESGQAGDAFEEAQPVESAVEPTVDAAAELPTPIEAELPTEIDVTAAIESAGEWPAEVWVAPQPEAEPTGEQTFTGEAASGDDMASHEPAEVVETGSTVDAPFEAVAEEIADASEAAPLEVAPGDALMVDPAVDGEAAEAAAEDSGIAQDTADLAATPEAAAMPEESSEAPTEWAIQAAVESAVESPPAEAESIEAVLQDGTLEPSAAEAFDIATPETGESISDETAGQEQASAEPQDESPLAVEATGEATGEAAIEAAEETPSPEPEAPEIESADAFAAVDELAQGAWTPAESEAAEIEAAESEAGELDAVAEAAEPIGDLASPPRRLKLGGSCAGR